MNNRLMTLRIIWAALLMGPIMFLLVLVFAIWPTAKPMSQEDVLRIEWLANVIMFVVVVPAAFVVRHVIYGKPREDGSIDPARYATGNIILWATCEGSAFFGLVIMFQSVRAMPYAIVPAVAMAVQVLTFPTGAALQPTRNVQ